MFSTSTTSLLFSLFLVLGQFKNPFLFQGNLPNTYYFLKTHLSLCRLGLEFLFLDSPSYLFCSKSAASTINHNNRTRSTQQKKRGAKHLNPTFSIFRFCPQYIHLCPIHTLPNILLFSFYKPNFCLFFCYCFWGFDIYWILILSLSIVGRKIRCIFGDSSNPPAKKPLLFSLFLSLLLRKKNRRVLLSVLIYIYIYIIHIEIKLILLTVSLFPS